MGLLLALNEMKCLPSADTEEQCLDVCLFSLSSSSLVCW